MYHNNQKIIKHKVGLLNLAENLNNISQACKIMGYSRDTFYRYKAAHDEGGIEALLDANRRKPNIKNRVGQDYEKAAAWYEKAAEQEHASAQYNLGNLYEYGQGVKKDKEQAIILWKKSATQGYSQAQEALDNLCLADKLQYKKLLEQ